MGMSIYAVAGIGIIIDLDKIEDPREELYDFFSEGGGEEEDGLAVLEVGSYSEKPAYFIGSGAQVSWNKAIDGEPIKRPQTSRPDLAAKIKKLLGEIPCADGSWLTLFDDKKLGFHVYPCVS